MAIPSEIECFFLLQNVPTIGSRMEMDITLPPEIAASVAKRVHCQGTVVRVERGSGAGKTGVVCTIEECQVLPAAADPEITA
ncbi:MAG: hypothetical protein HY651_13285 [Acidobacteria bacterium]|nr:hypothetical protein [Acidobacteriota bacterium]